MNDINPDLLAALLDAQGDDDDTIVAHCRDGDELPLSFSQQQLWFLQGFEPALTAYNLPWVFRLHGPLDADALERAFQAVIARHAVLRTRFFERDGVALQAAKAQVPFALERLDLRQRPTAERDTQLAAAIERTVSHVFDLTQPPLLVARLVQVADDEHVLAACLHHIVSDAGSNPVFARDLALAYETALKQRTGPVQLPPLALQFGDVAAWQRQRADSGALAREVAACNAYLGNMVPALGLPVDLARPARQTFAGDAVRFELPSDLAESVHAFCRAEKCTPFVVLLAAWELLLARHAGQGDFAVGVPHVGRHREEVQGLIGFFVSTQVFRVRVAPEMGLREWVRQVRADALASLSRADVPVELLLRSRPEARDPARPPLFQVMFGLQVADAEATLSLAGVRAEAMPSSEQGAKYELSLDITTQGQQIRGRLEFNTDLFTQDTAGWLAGAYQRVVQAMVARLDTRVGDLNLLSDAELAAVQAQGRNAQRFAIDAPVHRLFEQRAAETPDALALIHDDERLTYAELNRRANRVAHHLIDQGIGPESRVGVAIERSVSMIVGLLGVLKTGAAYVPLDPRYPAMRLTHMAEDSGLALLLTQSSLDLLPSAHRVWIDALPASLPAHNPDVAVHPANAAYVIYTSGSTGRPKGIAIAHHALAEHAQAAVGFFGLTAVDRMLQFSTLNFDGCVEQIYPPLIAGAAIVLRGPQLWDSDTFHRELIDKRISVADLTTAYWHLLVQDYARSGVKDHGVLRQVHAGGEAMPPEGLKAWRDAGMGHIKLLNTYGPTEATVTATVLDCAELDANALPSQLPIGQPLPGRSLHVLDAQLQPVPIGVPGELCIGGELLARGYVNRPSLTAERFVADPFRADGGRLYRTGDLVRWTAEGQLQYLGRIDHQVKVRGFRIELGEIEAQLLNQPGVRQAVVVARAGDAGTRLLAYVSPKAQASLDAGELRARLAAELPDYMVPHAVLVLAEVPLNPNGKIDRAALPEPDAAPAEAHEPPQGEVEIALAAVWADVLRRPGVGRHENFFELGGDSILCLQIVARLRQAGWRTTPRQLFERQTVAQLALVLTAESSAERVAGDAPITKGPLLPIQADFFAQPLPARHHWNQSIFLRSEQSIDANRLEQALQTLVSHHGALRMRYAEQGGEWTQRIEPLAEPKALILWHRHARNADERLALCNEAQRSLDIAKGPLLRALLVEQAGVAGAWLLLTVHHLVIDGVSWRILLEDLQAAYAEPTAELPPATSSFLQWPHRLQRDAQSFAPQVPHWLSLAGTPAALPLADPDGEHLAGCQQGVSLRLDTEATKSLLNIAPAAYRTQINDLLLAALAIALCPWAGEDQLLIDLEGHGRQDRYGDLDFSRTVGWFTTLHPVALDARGGIDEVIKRTKEMLRQVPEHGLGHGVLKHFGTPEQRTALAGLPQPRVVFNYLGQFDGSVSSDTGWQPATETGGLPQDERTVPEHELVICGQVFGGELVVDIRYSPARILPTQARALVDAYRRALLAVVEHCGTGPRGATPSDFPLAKLTQPELDTLPLALTECADLYPLSPMQAGMLFHSEWEEGAYQTQMRVGIDGLDTARFIAAWQAALDRHPILRTGFLNRRERPLQWVARSVLLHVNEVDMQQEARQAIALEALALTDRARGFDLTRPPLMRLSLVRTGERSYHVIWTCHHVLLDGWSSSQLLGEVLRHYAGEPVAASAPYRDYMAWLQAHEPAASEAFWTERLQPLEGPCLLADAFPAPAPSNAFETQVHALDERTTARLSSFAKAHHVTVYTLVQAAWALALKRLTGHATVCFGHTVSGRPDGLAGAERILGLFINTLPVISTPLPQWRVVDWLQQLQAESLAAREHEHTPLYDIQRWSGRQGQSLFDTLVVFENYPVDEALAQAAPGGLAITSAVNEERTHYPLTLAVMPSGSRLMLKLGHELGRFSVDVVRRLAGQLEQLLLGLSEDGHRRLGEVGLVTEAEAAGLAAWGCPAPAWPKREPVHRAIERQALERPNAPALLLGDAVMDFATLNRHANRLAHRLMAAGVAREAKIGVVVERSLDTFVGLLAVLKAGAAYVPLDPDYPAKRLAFMARDSAIGWLLSHSHLRERVPAGSAQIWLLDQLDLVGGPDHDPVQGVHSEQLAYVIYTSGSTGRPKGVTVAHGPLTMHCDATAELYEMGPHSREFHFLSLAFDGAHERWLTALRCGASIVLRGPGLWTAEQTLTELQHKAATHGGFPPAYLQQLADGAEQAASAPEMHLLSFGGEAMPRAGFDRIRRLLKAQRFINGYGPTEAVVTPLVWKTRGDAGFESAYAPIGSPCGDRTAHVLDADLQPVPLGAAGELYLGGDGLARGYLDRPALTAERFVPDPFSANGARLYRTGDWVRWRDDGQIEYLGRIDQQVKLRGFRIEIGEVEAQLRAMAGVHEAVAVVRESAGVKRLIGYVTASPGIDAIDVQALRAQMAQAVPEHMVPAAIVVLDRFPVTPNGKVDRQQLPEPDWQADRDHEPPQGEREAALAAAWAQVLGLERVGRHDNFFELGGDSIISLQIVAVARRLGWKVGPKQIFECKTVAALARVATPLNEQTDVAADDTPLSGDVPLLPLQQRFLDLKTPRPSHWNQSVLLHSDEPIDLAVLKPVLDALLRHHDALRMRFTQLPDGTWRQTCATPQADPELVWLRTLPAGASTSSARTDGEAPASTSSARTDGEAPASTSLARTGGEAPASTGSARTDGGEPASTGSARAGGEEPASTSSARTDGAQSPDEASMSLTRANPPPFALSLSKGLGETELVEGSATTIGALCAEAQQSLDLTHGPLLRALVIEVPGDGWRLLLTVHHLVIDGVSWRILLDDLRTAYEQQRTGAPIQLPSKTSSMRDWARKLQALTTDPATQPARAHWLSTTSDSIRLWGCDRPEGAATLRQAKTLRFSLAGADTQRLLRHAPAAYRTQVNHLLLAAWARAFAKHARGDGDGIRIDLEGHGREDLFDDIDLSRTVGWFTSVCPAVLPSAGESGDMLRRVKATLDALPHKGLSHGALQSFGDLAVRTKLAEAPRAEVLFNYLGQFDGGQGTQQGWRLARESGGASSDADSPLSHELAINGEVIDGVLAMSFTFSAARHDEARVQALMSDYQAELLALIDHCEHSAGGVSVADFPLVKLPPDELDALVARVAAKPRDIDDIVPLTPGQQTMFAESLEAPGTQVNIVQMQAKVDGLDVARLQAAWREALVRHPMLRTGFFAVDGRESMQVTLRHADSAIEWMDWRDRPLAQGLADWQALCDAERVRGFDLERPPLARWHVARLADGASRIAWTWHHLLLDGWSMSQLLGEVFTAYAGQPLKPAGPPFAAFVQALQRSTPPRDTDDQAFWRSRWALAGAPTRLCTQALSAWAPQGLASAAVTLDASAIAPLRRFAHAEQITLNTLVQAAWGLVLMSYLGRDGVCFGTTVSGRSVEMDDVDGVMGLCINQLPLMLRREPAQAVGDWLRSLLDANLALRQHEHTALGRIQQWIGVHEPLYDTLVVFENYPIDAAVTGGPGDALGLTEVVSHGALGTPMSLIAMPSPDGALTLSLEHARSLFEPAAVNSLLARLQHVLNELAHDAGRPLGAVSA